MEVSYTGMELWQYVDFTSGIAYLTNTFIYELDIRKANINVLYSKGIINRDIYEFLEKSERMVRQTYIGNLQHDTNVVRALQQGIIEAKKNLFQANNIQDYEVLSIKNDAVYLIGRVPDVRKFDLIEFAVKNTYTGFYKLPNMELYYFCDSINNIEHIDIKGIGDNKLELHKNFFVQFLKDLFYTIQCNGIEYALELMKDFYMQYISYQLPVGYYRRFDVNSDYHFKIVTSMKTGFAMDEITDDMKPYLDISCNLRLLIELQKILTSIYFDKYH